MITLELATYRTYPTQQGKGNGTQTLNIRGVSALGLAIGIKKVTFRRRIIALKIQRW